MDMDMDSNIRAISGNFDTILGGCWDLCSNYLQLGF